MVVSNIFVRNTNVTSLRRNKTLELIISSPESSYINNKILFAGVGHKCAAI